MFEKKYEVNLLCIQQVWKVCCKDWCCCKDWSYTVSQAQPWAEGQAWLGLDRAQAWALSQNGNTEIVGSKINILGAKSI